MDPATLATKLGSWQCLTMNDDHTTWLFAGLLADLPKGTSRALAHGASRIAIFHLADGTLAAMDDRCPHEGYPLNKGFMNDGVVTCRWHAFRFDVKTGHCLVGDEHARSYPVRIADGTIEVGIAPPDPVAERARFEESLTRGLERRRIGQVARDVARLLNIGAEPRDIFRHAIHHDAARAPYGTTHVTALCQDLVPRLPGIHARLGEDGLVAALLQPLDLCADPLAHQPPRVRPAPEDPGADPDATFAELRQRVETEDSTGAEALVRGAILLRQTPLATLSRWFQVLANDHLLDIGHGLIYFPKIFSWLAPETPEAQDLVLGAYIRHITLGTREELLPTWNAYLRDIDEPSGSGEPPDPDGADSLASLREALLDGPRPALIPAARRALAEHPRQAVIDVLVLAASLRLLRFDLAIERDPTVQDAWLDATHALTLASALRTAALPDEARMILLAAAFIHSRKGLDAPPDVRAYDETTLTPRAQISEFTDEDDLLQRCLNARDAEGILPVADHLARQAPDMLIDQLEDWCLIQGAARAIFAAHHHKTMLAAYAESRRLADQGSPFAHVPLVAAARFVAAPLQERSIMRVAHEANRFVRQSRVPRRLS